MITLTNEERTALLLSVLGEEMASAALESIHPTRAKYVAKLLREYQEDPPNNDEVEYIVDDFVRFFSFATQNLEKQPDDSLAGRSNSEPGSVQAPVQDQPTAPVKFESVEPTSDVISDLNQLAPYQIATAIANDNPKTIALVLDHLSSVAGAAVLKTLDDDLRNEVVLSFSQDLGMPDRIVQQILRSTFKRANEVRIQRDETPRSEVLAKLMRSLPKEVRNDLLDTIAEQDQPMAEDVRKQLYVFNDIARLSDRDIQKLIGEIKSDVLILALQQAAPQISERLLGNLSKRARAAIEEELQYKQNASKAEIEEAQNSIVETIGRLDESGDISMEN